MFASLTQSSLLGKLKAAEYAGQQSWLQVVLLFVMAVHIRSLQAQLSQDLLLCQGLSQDPTTVVSDMSVS